MNTYNVQELLTILQQDTELQLDKAIRDWQTMPDAFLSLTPANGGWSTKQCLSHLNGYGRYYLPAIEKAIAKATKKGGYSSDFRPGPLGDYFTRMMKTTSDGQPIKKMKTFKSHDPSNDEDAYAVTAEYIAQQEKTLVMLEQARNVDLAAVRIPISIAPFIRLKLGDVLMFVVAHNLRHFRQAERALTEEKLLAVSC